MASFSQTVRPAAVAGTFYPSTADRLERDVSEFLATATRALSDDTVPPKALIAPHAGYIYSGSVAGSAFAVLSSSLGSVTRVVLLGPSHFVGFEGIAAVTAEAFETPLGKVPIDRESIESACRDLPFVHQFDDAHAEEHCLEVELPFLQKALGSFSVAPFVTGETNPEQVCKLIDLLWGGAETLIIVSSDLSHYHGYDTARTLDSAAADAIKRLEPDRLSVDQACGRTAIQGLLLSAKHHGLSGHVLDLRNSGDTAGSKDRVVGYGAFSFS